MHIMGRAIAREKLASIKLIYFISSYLIIASIKLVEFRGTLKTYLYTLIQSSPYSVYFLGATI
jgi:hypothetical protein